jgi:hypothetical protein
MKRASSVGFVVLAAGLVLQRLEAPAFGKDISSVILSTETEPTGKNSETSDCRPPDPAKIVKDETGIYPVNEILVMLKASASKSDVEEVATRVNGKIVCSVSRIRLYTVEIPATNAKQLDEMIAIVAKQPSVKAAFRNRFSQPTTP